MQRDRRHNPYPLTWEIPLGIACALVLVLVLGVHTGRALANLVAGAGLTFPPVAELFTSVVSLIRGDAAAGLTHPPPDLAGPAALRAWVLATETVLILLSTAVGVLAWVRWGPGRIRGMATRTEAEHLLGLTRLRQARAVVRPDLYPSKKART